MRTALVVGANGIVGRNLTQYLESTNNWKIIAASYSPLEFQTKAVQIKLDLTDREAVIKQKDILKDITHVFFAAYVEKKTLAEQTSVNLEIMKNLIDGLEPIANELTHISFIQGGKAYGAHLGRFKTPARETDSRHFPPNFYYSQEDYLKQKSLGKKWGYTAIRPDIIDGIAIGNPMNIANVIAVYASLCRELKVAFRFPGSLEAYNALVNVTSTDVLSKGLEWAATNPACNGEIFNITNGDVFRWSEAWPMFAKFFEVEMAEPLTFSLNEFMADKEPLWKEMTKKYGIDERLLSELVQWPFGDFIFNNPYDAFFDVNKARRFGFNEMHVDTVEHLIGTFKKMRELKIIP